MKRYLYQYVKQALNDKIVLLTGARQCGKTTLAKQLFSNFDYLNFDAVEDRLLLKSKSWDRAQSLIIFDELHKMGDSLAGRYFQYRLFPLDLKEVANYDSTLNMQDAFKQLWTCGGFPEPFLKSSESYYKRWRRSHLDIILRQDLLDFKLFAIFKQ